MFATALSLHKVSKLSDEKVESFLEGKNAHTKYQQPTRKFPCLKLVAFDINETWSIDLSNIGKLARYNNRVKYLTVLLDDISYFPLPKSLTNEHKIISRDSQNNPANYWKEKISKSWSDKETQFRGALQQRRKNERIDTYATESKTESAFAEKNNASLKNQNTSNWNTCD